MKIKNILLTGDDGYNSIGTRVLTHFLKNKYRLHIAATKLQQSGVGGKISLNHPVHWDEMEIDGIKGLYVDGTPSDAVELAREYFKVKFDLVISGINLGVNIGGTYTSSGTVSSAYRAILLHVAKKSIALSLHVEDSNHYLRHHDGKENINTYLHYPGKAAYQLIELTIKNNFWDSELININFASRKTNKVLFTKPLEDLTTFYDYPLQIDYKNKTFTYPFNIKRKKNSIIYDTGAVQRGYISITLCKSHSLNEDSYKKLKDTVITL